MAGGARSFGREALGGNHVGTGPLVGRHHADESLVQKSVRKAVTPAGLTKQSTSPIFRHALATERP